MISHIFTGLEVKIGKNALLGLEYTDTGRLQLRKLKIFVRHTEEVFWIPVIAIRDSLALCFFIKEREKKKGRTDFI